MKQSIPKGFNWSDQLAAAAGRAQKYIRVGGDKTKFRAISGAERSWNKGNAIERSVIFIPTYNITGTPEDVRAALSYWYTPEDIENIMRSAITRENYRTTMADIYKRELENRGSFRIKERSEALSLGDLEYIINNMPSGYWISGSGEVIGQQSTTSRSRRGETLSERYRRLPEDKVLDVSNIDRTTGHGATYIPVPKTTRGKKYGTSNLPIVSDNPTAYAAAITILFGNKGMQTYAPDIAAIEDVVSGRSERSTVFIPVPEPAAPAELIERTSPPKQTKSPTSKTTTKTSSLSIRPSTTLRPQGNITLKATPGITGLKTGTTPSFKPTTTQAPVTPSFKPTTTPSFKPITTQAPVTPSFKPTTIQSPEARTPGRQPPGSTLAPVPIITEVQETQPVETIGGEETATISSIRGLRQQ